MLLIPDFRPFLARRQTDMAISSRTLPNMVSSLEERNALTSSSANSFALPVTLVLNRNGFFLRIIFSGGVSSFCHNRSVNRPIIWFASFSASLHHIWLGHEKIRACPCDDNRSLIKSQYSLFNSMPSAFLPSFDAATSVVPDPANGSKTVSPGSVNKRINQSGNASGKAAGWPL